jgi:hypothetical protein
MYLKFKNNGTDISHEDGGNELTYGQEQTLTLFKTA